MVHNHVQVEQYLTTERQRQLLEIAASGAPACAVRFAIRETANAVKTGIPEGPVDSLGSSDFVQTGPVEHLITDDRQQELFHACLRGLPFQAIRQACRETVVAIAAGEPARPLH